MPPKRAAPDSDQHNAANASETPGPSPRRPKKRPRGRSIHESIVIPDEVPLPAATSTNLAMAQCLDSCRDMFPRIDPAYVLELYTQHGGNHNLVVEAILTAGSWPRQKESDQSLSKPAIDSSNHCREEQENLERARRTDTLCTWSVLKF